MKVLDLEKEHDMHAHNALLVYQPDFHTIMSSENGEQNPSPPTRTSNPYVAPRPTYRDALLATASDTSNRLGLKSQHISSPPCH